MNLGAEGARASYRPELSRVRRVTVAGERSDSTKLDVAPLPADEAVTRLARTDLSDWFQPFLPTFARQAVGCGGRAALARHGDEIEGLLLTDPLERTASVFARRAHVVRALARETAGAAVYAEVDLGDRAERLGIHATRLLAEPPHRFRHPVRLLGPEDRARAARLLHEVYGVDPEAWLAVAEQEGERALGVDDGSDLAGVAWVNVVDRTARLHDLTVRPDRRRLGIGTDLVFARLLYARHRGVRLALSEIFEQNGPSRAAAERAGMHRAGQIFLYPGDSGRGSSGPLVPLPGAGPTSA
jgi:GNAT superfamily N-acetyltransferase